MVKLPSAINNAAQIRTRYHLSDNDEVKHERSSIAIVRVRFPVFGDGDRNNNIQVGSDDSSISKHRGAETRAVNRSKIVVLVVIAIAATGVCAATYFSQIRRGR
jgi:hypothetical protein